MIDAFGYFLIIVIGLPLVLYVLSHLSKIRFFKLDFKKYKFNGAFFWIGIFLVVTIITGFLEWYLGLFEGFLQAETPKNFMDGLLYFGVVYIIIGVLGIRIEGLDWLEPFPKTKGVKKK